MKKILFCNEFSLLNTGYSTYGREVISRLQKTGKYEIAELSCYIAPGDPAIQQVSWKIYPNLPHPSDERGKKEYGSSPYNAFGAWKFEEVCLDFAPDVVCVPPGSLVKTLDGQVKIEDIKVGDTVVTHQNRPQSVLKTFKRWHDGDMLVISISGGITLQITPEHPVCVLRRSFIDPNLFYHFVPARKLQVGDIVYHTSVGDLFTVEEIKKIKYVGYVHNLEVNIDNSYSVNDIFVHNCDARDVWMMRFEHESSLRPYFKWVIMPTVDAYPQKDLWIDIYSRADAVLTYQDWSAAVLRKQAGRKIRLYGSASPSANEKLRPMTIAERQSIRQMFGISPDTFVIGTVMRNQRRKLFPDLFAAFREFIDKTGSTNCILYCHTNVFDNGWDIQYLLKEFNVHHLVFFTYTCSKCMFSFPSLFKDYKTFCPKCKTSTAIMSNVRVGSSTEFMNVMYNMFDVYVQYAICGGFEMPIVEAAACGVPVIATDYSAMSDVVRKVNGKPLSPLYMYREMETNRDMAQPNNAELVNELVEFFEKPKQLREADRAKSRNGYIKNFGWDKAAQKWELAIDSVCANGGGKWNSPPNLREPPELNDWILNTLDNKEFARWIIVEVMMEPWRCNTIFEAYLLRDLNRGVSAQEMPSSLYFNDDSILFQNIPQRPFDRKIAYQRAVEHRKKALEWEKIRAKRYCT